MPFRLFVISRRHNECAITKRRKDESEKTKAKRRKDESEKTLNSGLHVFVISLFRLRYFVMSPSLFRYVAFVISSFRYGAFVMSPRNNEKTKWHKSATIVNSGPQATSKYILYTLYNIRQTIAVKRMSVACLISVYAA